MAQQTFPETNLQNQLSLDNFPAKSIDFTYQFEQGLVDLQRALGIMRVLPVADGKTIKLCGKPEVTLADGNVEEGDIIPLSKVTPTPVESKEIELKKYRKATSAEAITTYGFENAINVTDQALVQEIQSNVRNDLFGFIQTAGTIATNVNDSFQGALSTAWGTLQTVFEDNANNVIVFANPMDIAKHNADAQLSTQTSFGMNYVTNFTGVTLIPSHKIAEGKIYATVANNLVVAYVPANGEAGRAFNLTADNTGFLGMKHFVHNESATHQTLVMSGILLFPERLDGVVEVTISAEPAI